MQRCKLENVPVHVFRTLPLKNISDKMPVGIITPLSVANRPSYYTCLHSVADLGFCQRVEQIWGWSSKAKTRGLKGRKWRRVDFFGRGMTLTSGWRSAVRSSSGIAWRFFVL